MGVSIDLSGLKLTGNAKMLNDVSITGDADADIKVKNSELGDDVALLERLEIGTLFDKLQEELRNMDPASAEYHSLKQIVEMKDSTPSSIMAVLKEHLFAFSHGVLQQVVADNIAHHLYK